MSDELVARVVGVCVLYDGVGAVGVECGLYESARRIVGVLCGLLGGCVGVCGDGL